MRSDSPNCLVEISTGEDAVRELSPHALLLFTLQVLQALTLVQQVSQVSSLVERVLQALQVALVCPSWGDAVRRSFLLRGVSSRWRCLRLVHTSCALAWLQLFFLLTGFMRRVNDILHALQAFCLSSQ